MKPRLVVDVVLVPTSTDAHGVVTIALEPVDRVHTLPTCREMADARAGQPIPKGKTRIEAFVDERPIRKLNERTFKIAVWTRDKYLCRCCARRVIKTVARVPERGEVNHIHGRVGALRFEVRSALLLCLACHEKVTGRVNQHRLIIVPSQTFTIPQGTFTDATFPVVCLAA